MACGRAQGPQCSGTVEESALLIVLIDLGSEEGRQARGCSLLGGQTLAVHQLRAALAAGAERAVVLTGPHGVDESCLAALIAYAEGHHVRLDVVQPRELAGVLGKNDDLLVLADGLLIQRASLAAALPTGPAVLTVPADFGVPAGFERIDLTRAQAGIMRLPTAVVTRLAQVPPDWHVSSALVRIAAQEGVPLKALPDALVDNPAWRMIADENTLVRAEDELIAARLSGLPREGPSDWLSDRLVGWLGKRILATRWRSLHSLIGGAVLAALAVGLIVLGCPVCGFLALAVVWPVLGLAVPLAAIADEDAPLIPRGIQGWLFDAVLVACLVLGLRGLPWSRGWIDAGITALSLPLALRLVGRLSPPRWAALARDRALVPLALAVAAAFGSLWPCAGVLGVVLLALAVWQGEVSAQGISRSGGNV